MAENVVQQFERALAVVQQLAASVERLGPACAGEVVRLAHACCNSMEEVRRRAIYASACVGAHLADGFNSPAIWLTARAGMTRNVAAAVSRQAADMQAMPASRRAALEGRLDHPRVRHLTACYRAAPNEYTPEVDAELVAAASDHPSFLRRVRAWLEAAKPKGDDKPMNSYVVLFPSTDGYHSGHLHLTPEDGAVVQAALGQRVEAMRHAAWDGDPAFARLDIGALQARALVDLCELELRRDPRERRNDDPNRLTLTVYTDGRGFGPQKPIARTQSCADPWFDVLELAGQQLIMTGPGVRNWSEDVATAILYRDKRCRFPGCEVPALRCDIHECTGANGDRRSPRAGVLLCGSHHRFVHREQWVVTIDDGGVPCFRRRDGHEHGGGRGDTTAA
ncbi:MAG: hypothetical protein R2755_28170 [Acidimicrobiales bacterium]